jgi:hypothetical protein
MQKRHTGFGQDLKIGRVWIDAALSLAQKVSESAETMNSAE